MTQPTTDKARARLAAFLGYEPDEHDALFESHLDVYRAAVLREAADKVWALADRTSEAGLGALQVADMLRRMAEEARS